MSLTPPSIDKRLVELTQRNLEQTREQTRQETRQETRQRTRLMRSKSVIFLSAGIILLAVLIALGH